MKEKRKIYLIIYLFMAVIIIVVCFFINKKNKNDAVEAYCAEIKNWNYTNSLHIKGKFSYKGNKIYVEDIEYDDNQLMVDVAFYNLDHENEQITVEQLYKEYEAFLNGGEVDILKKFADYDNGDIGCDYTDYCYWIRQELKNIREEKQAKGEDVSIEAHIHSATPEELQDAINRVNMSYLNNEYKSRLYIKGDFSCEGLDGEYKLSAENPEYNDKLLMIDVEYANSCSGNEPYTIEQLYEEYQAFLNGEDKDKYKNLENYTKDFKWYGRIYNDYCVSVYDELELIRYEKEKKGEEIIIDDVDIETTRKNWKNISSAQIEIVGGSTEEIRQAISRVPMRYVFYASRLYIKGDFSYDGNKVSVENPEYSDKLLMIDVGFINYCNQSKPYTVEQLYEEFDAFLNGESKEKYINLENYIEAVGDYCDGSYYDDYCKLVDEKLEHIQGEKRKKGEQIIEDKESAKIARDNWTNVNDWRNTIVAGSSEEVQEAINLVNQRGMGAVRLLELSLQAVKILWKHTL